MVFDVQSLGAMEFRDLHERIAFDLWDKPSATVMADQQLKRTDEVNLKLARAALLISTGEMAKRLGMSRAGYTRLEKRSELGEITLKKLSNAAQALGCECVVVVRPLKRETFAERLWRPLLARVNAEPRFQNYAPRYRTIQMIEALGRFTREAKFRRSQGWSRRHV